MTAQEDHFKVHPVAEGCQLELRAIRLGTPGAPLCEFFHPSEYQSEQELEDSFIHRARQLNRHGYSIYTPMNSVRDDYVPDAGKGTNAAAIEKRTKILVDLDRKSDKKRPAHDDEITAMEELADRIVSYLQEQGWPVPHKVLSGNGYHLYYPVDLPVNDESEVLVKQTLVALAAKFNTDEFEIDTVVFDAPRITKVIGTVARKGEATLDRPHRLVELIK